MLRVWIAHSLRALAAIVTVTGAVMSLADKPPPPPAGPAEVFSFEAALLPPLQSNEEEPDVELLLRRIEELEASEAARSAKERQQSDADRQKKTEDERKAADFNDPVNRKWTVKLGGHVQLDYINWANADPAIDGTQDYFEFRRLRLVADGTGYGVYDFRLQMTLEPESVGESAPGQITTPEVKDAYFTINEVPWLGRIRIGNFFVPFSLEQVTNDTNNIFLERSIPSQGVFAADREVGLAMYNSTENQRLSWASGVFFDSISDARKERIDDNQGYRASGRLVHERTSQVCRLVCETKKVQITCYGCKEEDFCVPGPSRPGAEHCEQICESSLPCAQRRFVWTEWFPACTADLFTRKTLQKRTVTREIPNYKWVTEDLCPRCAANCDTAER